MPPGEREKIVRDVVVQLEELSELINDLIELARADEHIDSREEIRLDVLAGRGGRASAALLAASTFRRGAR